MDTARKPHHLQNQALICSKSHLSAPNKSIWTTMKNLSAPAFWLKVMICCSHIEDIICTRTNTTQNRKLRRLTLTESVFLSVWNFTSNVSQLTDKKAFATVGSHVC